MLSMRLALQKIGITTPISVKDTSASFITNAVNERMSFIQKHPEHASSRIIVDPYYRRKPAPCDGSRLVKAWLTGFYQSRRSRISNLLKRVIFDGGGGETLVKGGDKR